MNKDEIFNKLKPLVADRLSRPLEEVTLDKTLEQLRADSLDAVEVTMEVEKQFNLAIPDKDMEKFTNIQSIVDYVFEHQPVTAPEAQA